MSYDKWGHGHYIAHLIPDFSDNRENSWIEIGIHIFYNSELRKFSCHLAIHKQFIHSLMFIFKSKFIPDMRPEDARRALHAFSGLGKEETVNGKRQTIRYDLKGDLAANAGDESDVSMTEKGVVQFFNQNDQTQWYHT